ncbi:hypothetical protein [Streptomyces sp. NPDC001221]
MAGSFRIAEGYVEVTADESNYDRAMQRLRSKKTTATVTLDIDDSAALAKLRRFADEHSRTVLKAVIDADLSETSVRKVSAALDKLTADRVVNIRANVDTRVAAAEIRNLIQRRQVRIGVDVDTRVAADSLANLTRRRQMTVQANADITAARARLDLLTRNRTVNIRADVDRSALSRISSMFGGSLSGTFSALKASVTNLVVVAIEALPALASLGQSLIQMGPAAALAAPAVLSLGAAFAAIKLGMSGIGDAFKAAFAPATQSANSAASATRQVENAQRSLAKAQQAVKDAEVNAAAARVKAARDIADAQQNLKNTVQDVADSNRRAAESVASAERDLADAQRAAKQAQLDLTQARKDAAQQLEDLTNQLADAQLSQRQKVLDLQDAEQRLNADKAAGAKVSAEQLAKDQLAYDQAVQALKEQQIQTQRLQDQTDAANKAGVEGSATVTKAKQTVADANQTVKDKTQALADAEIEAARAQEDGAQRIAKAQRDVADAQAAAAKAAVDGARQIADAQENVKVAAEALADAQTKGALATDKVGNALAKLSPNARAFVDAVLAQREAWRGLKLDVQDALFQGLGRTFTAMSTAILPSLRTGLTGTASILNTMARNAAGAITQLGKTGRLRQLFDGLNAGLRPLTRIPGQIITGLTQISIAAAPAFKRLTTAAAGVADTISKKLGQAFKSGSLEDAINTAVGIAKQFGKLLGDIGGTISNVFKAAAAGGGNALGSLGAVFAELRKITAMPEVQKALTSIFTAINSIAKLVAGTLGAAIQALLPVVAAVAPFIQQLAEQLAPVLAQIFSELGKALMPVIQALMPIVVQVIKIVADLAVMALPLLQPLAQLIGAILQAITPLIQMVGKNLMIAMQALVTFLTPVIMALIPAVQMFGQLFAQLAPLFPPLYQALLPLLPSLGQLAASLLSLAMQVISPLMPLIVGLAQLLTGVLAGAIGVLVPVITTVIGWLTALADGAKKVVGWIVEGFQWLYDVLVGHSIIPDLVNAITTWFTSLWTKTKEIYTTLKNWVVDTWNKLWNAVRTKWDSFYGGLKSAVSGAWTWVRNSFSDVKNAITTTWSLLWNGVHDKIAGIFSTINGKISSFKTGMKNAFSSLRDSLGTIWDGVKSKIASPIHFVIGTVYNNGIRKMWNSIAGQISSKITLPAISLGFNKGGVVPGSGNSDTVPAMLTPGERILSKSQVAQLGGHRGIDAMLGQDHPTRTGGNPTQQQERRREQASQHFAGGGIVGAITSGISSATSWAKDLVIGGLKAAAQKALSALVRPLINQIPGSGIGNLMRGLVNKGVDGMLGWFGNEDKKATGGPAVQRALAWVKTQDGLPYQWAGNGNPSWDCSGLMSAIESVIRGEKPHRRWATGAFSGSSGPSGWVRNLNSPFMIGITNAGVGHTAGTLAGMNVESSGGRGVHMGKSARGYNDPLFTSRWGFAPAAKYDSGGLLQPGATMVVNGMRKPEAVLTPAEHEAFRSLVRSGGGMTLTFGDIVIKDANLTSPADRKRVVSTLIADIKEGLRQYDRSRAR